MRIRLVPELKEYQFLSSRPVKSGAKTDEEIASLVDDRNVHAIGDDFDLKDFFSKEFPTAYVSTSPWFAPILPHDAVITPNPMRGTGRDWIVYRAAEHSLT